MHYNNYCILKIVTPLLPWSSSGSPSCHFTFVHFLHQSVTIHFLHSHLSPSLLLLHNIHYHLLSKRSPHNFISHSVQLCHTFHSSLEHLFTCLYLVLVPPLHSLCLTPTDEGGHHHCIEHPHLSSLL